MGCGCKQRGELLAKAGKQIRQGEYKPAIQTVTRVAISMKREAARIALRARVRGAGS